MLTTVPVCAFDIHENRFWHTSDAFCYFFFTGVSQIKEVCQGLKLFSILSTLYSFQHNKFSHDSHCKEQRISTERTLVKIESIRGSKLGNTWPQFSGTLINRWQAAVGCWGKRQSKIDQQDIRFVERWRHACMKKFEIETLFKHTRARRSCEQLYSTKFLILDTL